MKQVLFCVDQTFLKDLIRIHFRHSKFIQPIVTDTAEEADDIYHLTQDIDVIITQAVVRGENAAKRFEKLQNESERPIQIIILGQDPNLLYKYEVYPLEKIKTVFDNLRLKFGGTEAEDVSEDDCVSMPAHLFLHFHSLPFDIFMRVHQGADSKYVKRFNASEPIEHDAVSKYIGRGVQDFYLKREWLKDFSKILMLQLESRLTEASNSQENKILAEGEVFNSLKDMVQSLGLKPQVARLCEISMNNMQRRLHQDSPFKSFLENLKSNQELSFHFAFVQLTSLLCSQYVEHTEWPKKQKDDLIEKLIFSSFFCDMTLSKDEHLMCRSDIELKNFNSKDMQQINNHAQKTVQYIKSYPGSPQEVDKIILQHHGSVNGVGLYQYPLTGTLLSSQILFYSQDLALRILMAHGKSLREVLKDFQTAFKDAPQSELINKILKSFEIEHVPNH